MKRIENVCYYRDADLGGIEVCRVKASSHVFPKHAHDDIYAVGLMEIGSSWCLGPDRDDAFVDAGELALINPGQVHSGVPADNNPVTYRMIYVQIEQFIEMARAMSEKEESLPEFKQLIVRDPSLYRALIHLCWLMDKKGRRLEKQSIALEAFHRMLSSYGGMAAAYSRVGGERFAVRRAKEFLTENLDAKCSLSEAADVVGLSRYHFLRVFKHETGLPPHLFRTQRRIDAAQRLLKDGVPFSQVALATGFSDQSHFTNKFRQFTGATPSQYLSRHRTAKT
jgi:AraC-like DNA-binding protein